MRFLGELSKTCWSIVGIGLLALFFAAGCGRVAAPTSDGERPSFQFTENRPLKIFCTTGQVADAIRHLVGDDVEVSALMGPGIDPHLYTAVPSDIVKLKSADIVFYNGLHLEGRIVQTLEKLGQQKPVVALTGQLEQTHDPRLRKPADFEGFHDPHVWHDVLLWADCIDYAAAELAKFDPARAQQYQTRAQEYRGALAALDQEVRVQMATIPENRRILVTAHDAFGYFSRAYGLQPYGLKGISTDDEVGIGRMDEVIALIIQQDLPAVFVESSTAPRIVEALIEPCQRQGHTVRIGGELYADALGPAESGADSYEGMIRANVQTIVQGLNGTTSN